MLETVRPFAITAGLVAIGGIILQSLLAPAAPAWGFYETIGFVVAAAIMVHAVVRVFRERHHPE